MKIVWAQEKFVDGPSIFLAGPTMRDVGHSWREDACNLLKDRDVVLYVPEFTGHGLLSQLESADKDSYGAQVEWEQEGLTRADQIVFWVPRNLVTLPGFTTNIEFGMWCDSGKIVLGYPPFAPKMQYFEYMAKQLSIPSFRTLDETLEAAMKNLEGC